MDFKDINSDLDNIKKIILLKNKLKANSKSIIAKLSGKISFGLTAFLIYLNANFYTETPINLVLGATIIFSFIFFATFISIYINRSICAPLFNKKEKKELSNFMELNNHKIYNSSDLSLILNEVNTLSEEGKSTLKTISALNLKDIKQEEEILLNLSIDILKKIKIEEIEIEKLITEINETETLSKKQCISIKVLILRKYINEVNEKSFLIFADKITTLIFSEIDFENQEKLLNIISDRMNKISSEREEVSKMMIKKKELMERARSKIKLASDFYKPEKKNVIIKEI